MITFKDFLEEAHAAGVYVKGNLFLLGDMFEKTFGIEFDRVYLQCLASQFVYSLQSVSGLKPQELADAGDPAEAGDSGASFETLFNAYNKKWLTLENEQVKFDLSLEHYSQEEAIDAVKKGQPSVAIMPVDNTWHMKDTGIAKKPAAKLGGGNVTTHALLLVGYDADEKTLIFRENRSNYAKGGFLKFKSKHLSDANVKYIAVLVDDFNRRPIPKSVLDARSKNHYHDDDDY